ncbi:HET-domain-containing protein [Hyaloscypha variabilis F]|uniref:HET-domain-containing protein n=1 Tax=Hyaloscypha variabilis (strain UAMH 11265 / GT02V1 / F) TaxID=1149755 RepID=A0A2J6RYC7_HYAVF|nr:HET-domain-containing protein [Hyaloscypha variabilis F]
MSIQNDPDLYSPLHPDDIRVLALHPGSSEDPIDCHLEHQKRASNTCTPYEALSYMWGPPEPSKHILLNGRRCEVRQNLWAALRKLRNERSIRYLWVDALCINQQNLRERSAQVLIMSVIYHDMLIDILNDSKGEFGLVWRSPGQLCRPRVELTEERMATARNALEALCRRPYWRRVWIIQEILSASSLELHCGSKSFAWTYFGVAFASIEISLVPSVESTAPAALIQREWAHYRIPGETISLQRLLELCSRCESECQDVRDRIYGVLSITNDKKGLTPEYTKTSLELYHELLLLFFPVYDGKPASSRQFPLNVYDRASGSDAWPFTKDFVALAKQLNQLLAYPTWNQYTKCLSFPEIEMIQRRLATVPAVAFVTICTLIADISGVMTPEDVLGYCPADILQVGETKIETDPDRLPAVRAFLASMDEHDIHKRTSLVGECYSHDYDSKMWAIVPEYEKEEAAAGHFRIFSTSGGNIGIASDKIEKNDLICFITGSHKIGFVIRPLAPFDHSQFLLIGRVIMLDPELLIRELFVPWNTYRRFYCEFSWKTFLLLLL